MVMCENALLTRNAVFAMYKPLIAFSLQAGYLRWLYRILQLYILNNLQKCVSIVWECVFVVYVPVFIVKTSWGDNGSRACWWNADNILVDTRQNSDTMTTRLALDNNGCELHTRRSLHTKAPILIFALYSKPMPTSTFKHINLRPIMCVRTRKLCSPLLGIAY